MRRLLPTRLRRTCLYRMCWCIGRKRHLRDVEKEKLLLVDVVVVVWRVLLLLCQDFAAARFRIVACAVVEAAIQYETSLRDSFLWWKPTTFDLIDVYTSADIFDYGFSVVLVIRSECKVGLAWPHNIIDKKAAATADTSIRVQR